MIDVADLPTHAAVVAAHAAVRKLGPLYDQSPGDIIKAAALGAVKLDRKRMAEKLRNRVLSNTEAAQAPPEDQDLLRKFDAMMLDLADQIERGIPDESPQVDRGGQG